MINLTVTKSKEGLFYISTSEDSRFSHSISSHTNLVFDVGKYNNLIGVEVLAGSKHIDKTFQDGKITMATKGKFKSITFRRHNKQDQVEVIKDSGLIIKIYTDRSYEITKLEFYHLDSKG